MISIKEIITFNNWVITKVLQGSDNFFRIDAKRRFPTADKKSFISKWTKKSYLDKICYEEFGISFEKKYGHKIWY